MYKYVLLVYTIEFPGERMMINMKVPLDVGRSLVQLVYILYK